jgi:ribonuclease J
VENTLSVIPLGGVEEIGLNMTVLEYNQDIIVIDAGLMFPD